MLRDTNVHHRPFLAISSLLRSRRAENILPQFQSHVVGDVLIILANNRRASSCLFIIA